MKPPLVVQEPFPLIPFQRYTLSGACLVHAVKKGAETGKMAFLCPHRQRHAAPSQRQLYLLVCFPHFGPIFLPNPRSAAFGTSVGGDGLSWMSPGDGVRDVATAFACHGARQSLPGLVTPGKDSSAPVLDHARARGMFSSSPTPASQAPLAPSSASSPNRPIPAPGPPTKSTSYKTRRLSKQEGAAQRVCAASPGPLPTSPV